jgi:ribosomal protein S18 acetylase RimI-like enzyme
MTIEVREVRPEEHAEAGEVTADSYREFAREDDPEWHGYLERMADVKGRAALATVLVAIDDGRIVATATLELDGRIDDDHGTLAPDEAHIRMLGVHPDARGRQIGTLLMAACEERARAAGRTLITLNTAGQMEAAQRMYGSLGYQRGEDWALSEDFVLLSYSKRLV